MGDGCFFLVNLVFQILSGPLAHRRGNLSTALAGSGLGFAGGIFYLATFWHTGLIFPARVFHAAGAAMVFAGALMELVKSVPPHLRGRMIGYYGLPGFVMMGVGPMTSEWFVYHWGFASIFGAVILIYAGLALILSRLPRPLATGVPPQPFSEAFRDSVRRLRSILVLSVFFGLCFSAWNSFLAPAVRSVGPGAVSSFGLGYGIGAVVTRLCTSNWLESSLAASGVDFDPVAVQREPGIDSVRGNNLASDSSGSGVRHGARDLLSEPELDRSRAVSPASCRTGP